MKNIPSSNATDRIVAQSSRRQRERAQIPIPRSATIIENSLELTPIDSNNEPQDKVLDTTPVENPEIIPSKASIPQELDLENGTTIRLQRSVFRETKLDGVEKDYNRDTFFESAWIILKDHPDIQEKVIAEAQRRSILRRQLGRTRAAKTMGKKAN